MAERRLAAVSLVRCSSLTHAVADPPLRMSLSVRVLGGHELAGVLTVYSPYAFSETDRLLVESSANELPAAWQARPGEAAVPLQRAV